MNLPVRLAEIARVSPGQEAIVFKNRRMTYAQLETRVNQLAGGLQQLGIKSGDRVLMAMSNCPEFVIAYYAIIRMKGIVVPISPQHTINEFAVVIKDCQPTAVITTSELKEKFVTLKEKMNVSLKIIINDPDSQGDGFITLEQIFEQGTGTFHDTKYSREDVAVILYTAATAGKPKGAMLTNYNLYSNALTFSQLCRMTPSDRALLTAPVYHAAAQTCVMNNSIVAGATMVIQKKWQGAAETLKIIAHEKISFFFSPPTIYNFIINYEDLDKYDTSSLRIALTGAATMPADLYEEFETKMKLPVTEGYGLTETSPVVTINFVSSSKKPGSIGKPIPGVEVKIFDYEDREVPQGQVGEIVVRGPNVMKGYYNQEEETRWALRNGWFHTGDLAYFDQDGDLYIVDRKKELIIRGGININPREVEEVLYDHPDIFEVAVVGVPDAVMGEEVLAFIMPREGKKLDDEQIKKFCEGKMANYKIPRYYKFVENIPKTSSGKLLRKELLNWISKQ
ncbi:long-chain acyl-CoA synthetase [Desulfotomaculum arcticum]|uniref:Long-chain acyl-CoA synthetase n=1 Tax=Desulfotruncus arcticus DSM 17038 TaxID=1121424 RepID=A0A1I2QEX3_9FIRM|nr:long-chain fatty acid--CoA ligase [Desulfotruncus arcticus]SFG27095.1 long-chain acyl-CoA synthetase [Desulfotomaculum arcticum] [Desulfotruncus arcticus DSM 17038]